MSGDNHDLGKILEHPIMGWIDGPNSRPIKVDKWSRALITVDNDKHNLWRGYQFTCTASTLVNTGGKLGVFAKANYSRPDFRWYFNASTAAILRNYLKPAQFRYDAGNPIYILNRNLKAHADGDPATALSVSVGALTTGATADPPVQKIYLGSAAGPGGISISGGQNANSYLAYINDYAYFEIEATTDDCAITMEFNWNEMVPYDTPPLVVPV
ncbi:MAG: hypothetical protein ACYTBJ_00545 [Planctomycetota bacterium]|jgi:hypothetical protein